MDMPNIITSNSTLPNIEQHFRVSAGPGAGKTHWLIQHIKNVLHHSTRLGKTRNIACITYTNIAVETILGRLGTSIDRVEVSTIHSFLYRHIVKPYIGVSGIATEYGLDTTKMDGHDDKILSDYQFLQEWKQQTRQTYIRDDKTVKKALGNLKWKLQGTELEAKTDYPFTPIGSRYAIKNESYLEYKKMTWALGFLYHDDVLFFSYKIITRCPFVLTVLRHKFPFFLLMSFKIATPYK